MPMPDQKPGKSKQDYGTPEVFLAAVRTKLGITDFKVDLAADAENAVVAAYWGAAENSLLQDWAHYTRAGWGWLNPPFADLAPWVEKAYVESQRGGHIAMLVPAGVGSNWWRDWVHEKAHVLLLNGRLTFVGQPTCYPKDCCLLLYTPPRVVEVKRWYEVWSWMKQIGLGG